MKYGMRTLPGRCLLGVLILVGGPGVHAPTALAAQTDSLQRGTGVADSVATPARVVEWLGVDSTRARGSEALTTLAASLPADRATPWIQLMATLRRVPDSWAGSVARSVLAVHEGNPEEGLERLGSLLDSLDARSSEAPDPDRGAGARPESDRVGPLLALAARIAEGVDPPEAIAMRERIVAEWPESDEAPEAALLLGRTLLQDPERAPEGLAVLEELLVRRPAHPVAPEARRLRQEALARGVRPPGTPSPEGP